MLSDPSAHDIAAAVQQDLALLLYTANFLRGCRHYFHYQCSIATIHAIGEYLI